VLLVTVLLAAAVMLALHRLALRPLRRLTVAADNAAQVTLPAAVEIAQNEGTAAARLALPELKAPADRDLAGLAAALNSAQAAALALATDEAELRSKVNAVFLNFGHRTQELVTSQLGHIDDLEARTEDPDTLSDLFLLDHLATRLRRNAESLVVMAGADSPRPWTRPVSVVNVVRAAVAEAVDYSRVDVESIAQGAVQGVAANDVSHLLAELVDNALTFSPPGARVRIVGGWVDSQYLVTVTDAGAGMSSSQLDEANEHISGSNVTDPGMSRYFGMFVVGRFARRHGIDVHLVPSGAEGTTAEVLLPDELMVGPVAECQTTTGR
jgi:signal transduction histidine kinase